MSEIEFKCLTEPLAVMLTGKGVFIASVVITAKIQQQFPSGVPIQHNLHLKR